MPPEPRNVRPRHFFLNEKQELARGEKPGGGRIPDFVGVNWQTKGAKISHSLVRIRDRQKTSRDPLRDSRYFVLALPTTTLEKKSQDKRKAKDGKLSVNVDYSEDDSKVFGRLGLDLIQVYQDGTAMVHARQDRFQQLLQSSERLGEFGPREKARWATLDSFDVVPIKHIIDLVWVNRVRSGLLDAVIELQPLLTTVEVDQVVRALAEFLKQTAGEALKAIGSDFSGRRWLRGMIGHDSLTKLAHSFFSIQSIHEPLFAAFLTSSQSSKAPKGQLASPPTNLTAPSSLPCVGMLDTGVPPSHLHLARYRRGQYVAPPPALGAPIGDHGSIVASRIVFGDLDCSESDPVGPSGECSFYDVNIAVDQGRTDEKSVLPALDAIVGVAPDVRVFNLSFDNVRPLDMEEANVRREKLILVQDLDNFIFARDVLVVVAAGNSPHGVLPSTPYPNHADDPQWALGTWPRSFNSLTCGSFVDRLRGDGLAAEIGAPSPFTKVGPGLCESPKPDFSDHGGNGDSGYTFRRGLGVWGCNAAGTWTDMAGTSFAAPLLARQAALVFRELERFCESGARPFAATVKAYLALSARQRQLSAQLMALAERTLGKGKADVTWLRSAIANKALILWQGVLDGPDEIVRVQLPIPRSWLKDAKAPRLRLVTAWDAPVNAAVEHLWASRKVNVQLRAQLETRAFTSSRGSHRTYPLTDRVYHLDRGPEGVDVTEDLWVLEISYEQAAEYYPALSFSPQQRVGIAAEIWDDAEKPVSPQPMLQALPAVALMTRLSVNPNLVRAPVVLKSRI
jgi:hypothetical protein